MFPLSQSTHDMYYKASFVAAVRLDSQDTSRGTNWNIIGCVDSNPSAVFDMAGGSFGFSGAPRSLCSYSPPGRPATPACRYLQ